MKPFIAATGIVVSLCSSLAPACTGTGKEVDPLQSLSVAAPSFSVRDENAGPWLTTLGTLRNASANCIWNVVLEVKYFDGKHNLIDSVTQPMNESFVVGPSQEVAFRIRDAAARHAAAYASQEVRVVSADAVGERKPQGSDQNLLVQVLIQWAPILLLVGAWIYFSRKFGLKSRGSSVSRSLDLMERQTAIFERQNELMERMAAALEARKP